MSITLTQLTGSLPVDVQPPGTLPPSGGSGWTASVLVDAYGAAGNGEADDSAAFRRAAATGLWVELGPRTYRVDAGVLGELAQRVLLRGIPGVSTIRLGTRPDGDWQRIVAPDVWIDGVIFDANATLSGGAGWPFLLTGQTGHVSLRRCAFIGAGWGLGRGLVIKGDVSLPATLSVELDDVHVSGAAADGIWIEHAARVVGRRLDLSGNGDTGMRIQRFDDRAGAVPSEIVIRESRFCDNAGSGLSAGIYAQAGATGRVYGPDEPELIGLSVEDCEVTGNGGYGVYLVGDRVGATRVHASGNGLVGPQGGITVQARHGWVRGCQVHDQAGIAIDVGGSREIDVSGNEVWSCETGLTIGAGRVTGIGNRVWDCTGAAIAVFDPESADGTLAFPVRSQLVQLVDTVIDISACEVPRAILIADNAPVLLDGLHVVSTDAGRTALHAIGSHSSRLLLRRGYFNGTDVSDCTVDGTGTLTVPDLAGVVRVAGTAAIGTIRTQSQADLAGGIAWVEVIAPGIGYSAAAANVAGDGSGANVQPMIWDGQIAGARVLAPGSSYTAATASVTGTGGGAALALQVGLPVARGWAIDVVAVDGCTVLGVYVPAGGRVTAYEQDGEVRVSALRAGDGLAWADAALGADYRAIAFAIGQIYTGAIGLVQPEAQRVFQRDSRAGGAFGLGVGEVTLEVAPSQPITTLEYRLRDAASPASVLQGWTSATPPLAAGDQVIAIDVPASLHWYLIDLRANSDDVSIVSTTAKVGVGEVIGIAGQSLAEAFLTTIVTGDPATIASLGVSISPYGVVLAAYASNGGAYPPVADGPDINYPPPIWKLPADGSSANSTGVAELLRLVVAQTGVPAAVVGYAVGGTSISSWLPGYVGPNTGHWEKLVTILGRAGGKFGAFIWSQGHYESKNGSTSAQYLANLQALFSDLSAEFPSASYKKLILTIPGVGSYGSGPSYIEMVRATAQAFAASDPNAVYIDAMDTPLWTDLVHPSQAGNITYARHIYRALMGKIGLHAHGDAGPVMGTPTRTFGSQLITIPVTQINAGTALVAVGSPANQFKVFPSGATSGALALDGTTPIDLTDPSKIVLKLAAAPTDPVALDVWYRLPPDDAGVIGAGIYDNVMDGDGIAVGRQLTMTATALSVPAPAYNMTVATPAPSAPSTTFTVTGTYSGGGTPAALDYSLDGGTTWIAATSPTIGGGSYSFSLVGGVPVGTFVLRVRDHSATTTFGVSVAFAVAMTSPPTLPTIASPIFAFDATDVIGRLYEDALLTVQAANGSKIGGLKDGTLSGNDMAQGTAAARPALAVNVKNSMPGLRFTGSASQLLALVAGAPLFSVLKASTGYTSLVVFTPATTPSTAADIFTLGQGSVTTTNKLRLCQMVTSSSVVRHARTSDATVYAAAVSAAFNPNELCKAISRYDGTNVKCAVNALTEASTAAGSLGAASFSYGYMGATRESSVDQFFFDGWVHEVRIWNTAVDNTVKANLATYATAKWGS